MNNKKDIKLLLALLIINSESLNNIYLYFNDVLKLSITQIPIYLDLLERKKYIRFDSGFLDYCITEKSKKILEENLLLGKSLSSISKQKIEVFDKDFYVTYRPNEN